ncbi:MAG: 23S rRNA pseudouridine(955/2504/2580) synthase RluC [Aliidiomarina sp.]|uniref:23S rRNA pseudouridine(955/2504/2580) synthase RluC n=1 Tax=Aliidiomarina sp. TaxID=1872439 RepID=UPI0025B86108|nr:23S rRNA pseudouridine(955/2504/2580) synthase RluC [Aliidiomarina sp.]MCH8500329.1 23S rRNA pseudouridine(955/2504/2580) synthase RluC [Aliidiomarina sp.]
MTHPNQSTTATDATNPGVRWYTVDADEAGQRLDNFLLAQLKGVPKSMIYRIVRKGEVRINKKRCKPDQRLAAGDEIRIPPVRVAAKQSLPNPKLEKVAELEGCILYEDDIMLVVNKPSGTAVHGGSGLSFGLIEGLRALRPQAKFLELVHRLDRDTSGVLLVAKKRSALRALHEQLRDKQMEKIYLALVYGSWPGKIKSVDAPLQKNTLQSGERVVRVADTGKPSLTKFRVRERFPQSEINATLVEASPITGRTHQIRVHAQCVGHPIAGDTKYGIRGFDEQLQVLGLNRLFLHAQSLTIQHPKTGEPLRFEAPLDPNLQAVINKLRNS